MPSKPKKGKPTSGKPEAAPSAEDELATLKAEYAAELAKFKALTARLEAQVREGKTKKRGNYDRFPIQVSPDEPDPGPFHLSEIIPFKEIKLLIGEWAIRKERGDKPAAAKKLDIALRTFYNWFPEPQ